MFMFALLVFLQPAFRKHFQSLKTQGMPLYSNFTLPLKEVSLHLNSLGATSLESKDSKTHIWFYRYHIDTCLIASALLKRTST